MAILAGKRLGPYEILSAIGAGGTDFLVMEFLEGETLRERVAREGALPVDEALGIALQIAEALETAHEKVTPEGRVSVLDFGLAKAFAGSNFGKLWASLVVVFVASVVAD